MTANRAALVVLLAGLAAAATVTVAAPDYLVTRGFPLDDAWIHAVYGRSVARSGMLAYNSGIPATGATSPLWALMLALPHLITPRAAGVVLGIKLLGLALHLGAAWLLVRVFAERGRVDGAALTGCVLVAAHPDLVSASVSGMEVSLATLAASALLLTAGRSGAVGYGLCAFVAALARPELSLLAFAIPLALFVRRDHGRLLTLIVAAGLGNAAAHGAMAIRNLRVSGLPLPATFYAKVGAGNLGVAASEVAGFSDLLGRLPIVDASILLLVAVLVAVGVVSRPQAAAPPRQHAAAALLAGVLFCAASFLLVPPVDPRAFYHQRYVLPAVPLMVAAMPILVSGALSRWLPGRAGPLARTALLGLLVLSVLVVGPGRYARLSNDAHNIDDVQVAIGQHLASAPPDHVVWAVDAGAVRYFGEAFVVDMLGLNNAELLGPRSQLFLDAHAPRYIEAVPAFSALDEVSGRRLRAALFQPSTPYTVTSYAAMQQHWLVLCDDPATSGRLAVRSGANFAFRCASVEPRRRAP